MDGMEYDEYMEGANLSLEFSGGREGEGNRFIWTKNAFVLFNSLGDYVRFFPSRKR